MTKNGPHAGEDRLLLAVDNRHLARQEARQSLGHGEPDRFGHECVLFHNWASLLKRSAMAVLASWSFICPLSQSFATSLKIVGPMANPFTLGWPCVTVQASASSASGASSPRSTMPRQCGSLPSMTA